MANSVSGRKGSVQLSTSQKQLIGYLLGLLAHLAFCSQNYFTKRVRNHLSSGQVQYFVFMQLGIYSYFIAPYRGAPVVYTSPKTTLLLIGRALIGMFNTYLVFYSLKLIPLSESTVIGMISPVITAAMSTFFFSEKFERVIMINGALGILGVIMIAKPAFLFGDASSSQAGGATSEAERTLGIILSLICATIGSLIQIIIKKCGALAKPLSMTCYFGLLTAFVTPVTSIFEGEFSALTFADLKCLLFSGLFGVIAHVSLSMAYQFGEAGKIALLQYAQIIFAFMYEIIIDGRKPDDYSIMGTGFILLGFFVLVVKTMRKPAPAPIPVETAKPAVEAEKPLINLKV